MWACSTRTRRCVSVWLFDCVYTCCRFSNVAEQAYALSGCMYVAVRGREKYRACPCLCRALLLEQPPLELLVVAMWRVVWWESWQDREKEGHGDKGAEKMEALTVRGSWYPPGDLCLFWKDPWSPTAPEASAPGGSSTSSSLHLHWKQM